MFKYYFRHNYSNFLIFLCFSETTFDPENLFGCMFYGHMILCFIRIGRKFHYLIHMKPIPVILNTIYVFISFNYLLIHMFYFSSFTLSFHLPNQKTTFQVMEFNTSNANLYHNTIQIHLVLFRLLLMIIIIIMAKKCRQVVSRYFIDPHQKYSSQVQVQLLVPLSMLRRTRQMGCNNSQQVVLQIAWPNTSFL